MSETKLAAALLAAQKAMPAIHKDSEAEVQGKTKDGKFYKYTYKYLSLQTLLEVVLPVLNDSGLALTQVPTLNDGRSVLRTVLYHESGETLEADSPLVLTGNETPQTWGGAVTYARRYALTALLGIAADEDDDGAEASRPKVSQLKNTPVVKTDDEEELARLLGDIDTVIDALSVAKGNAKADWVAKLDEQNGTDWRTDVTSAQMVLAKVRRWASMSGATVTEQETA